MEKETAKINMMQGDCMDLMRSKPDNFYDLAIVDPPYGLGKKTTSGGVNKSKGGKNYQAAKWKNHDWDNVIPSDSYFFELQRVSKNQIVWGGNYFPYLWDKGCRGLITWDKMVYLPTMSQIEYAWYSKDVLPQIVKIDNNDTNRIHPTQKPVKLYEWLLMNYATCKTCRNQGGYYEDVAGDGGSRMWQVCEDCTTYEKPVKILDTHGGSGSICLACHNLGFDLDWIELDEDYYEAACKRYDRHIRQLRMF